MIAEQTAKTKENKELIKVRCPNCNKLANEASKDSYLLVRCTRCKTDFTFENGVVSEVSTS